MKKQLTDLIVQRLREEKENLRKQFFQEHGIQVARHFALDNVLPIEIAEKIAANFPKPKNMHSLSSFGQLKLKYGHLKDASSLIQDINFAIQDPRVVAEIEEITGVKNQIPDPSRFAGGMTMLLKGHYINPHVDNSHDVDKKFYRTMNFLYYLSPGWKLENGGNYELWDEAISHCIVVPSLFNRIIVMETNRHSWHAVNPVLCDAPRCCVFNYFFSQQSPEGEEYFNVTTYRPRPEQKVRRMIASMKDKLFGKIR